MPQLSYSLNSPAALYSGQSADNGLEEVLTGLPLPAPAKLVTITVANSTAYELTFETGAVDQTAGYTSDGSATKAEIVAGLIAAVNADQASDYYAVNYGGDLVLVAKAGVQEPRAVTSTGAGTLSLADLTVTIPFGHAVALDAGRMSSSDPQAIAIKLPNSASDVLLGLAKHTHYFESTYFPSAPITKPAYPAGMPVNVAKRGRFWVKVEEAVSAGDQAYVRYNDDGNGKGAFRKSLDGAAQVITYTPTAVNDYAYSLSVGSYTYTYQADGSATATEIGDAFRTLVNADTALHGVTATGTTTLILTGAAGASFTYSASANMAAAVTTAAAPEAMAFPGARFLSAAQAGEFAILQLGQ